ncbi:hypothetical protein BXO88_04635 [Oribacterium sp. C9]|uniref:transporter n=1 Tax=Oribacterium sp. C9 TaxID=1943579 RepID=UPI0009D529CD|nr:transporter [Oribacterium sp. C9]OON87163.1 hypothetical protein BXO88_04635 [Oribacterium sp. C9]
MKKKFRFKLLMILALCFVISAFTLKGFADFGSYSGDSDYGSDSWSSSDSGWSSSDYSSGGYSYYGGSGSSSSDGFFWDMVVPLIVFIIIFIFIIQRSKNISRLTDSRPSQPVNNVARSKGRPISEYTSIDPGFDSAELAAKLSNVYVKLQNAWQDKDLEPIRPYLTDDFYAQMDRQLSAMKSRNQTNYIERIAVLSSEPVTFYQENGMDHIVAILKTRIVDYTLDDRTGALVSGNKVKEKFMTYEYDLCRKSGITTHTEKGLNTVTCPHCGAPLDINQTAKCPYCGSVITVVNEDWAIKSIKGISQRTS